MKHDEGLIKPDKDTLTYDRYLKVPEILRAQVPLADPEQHDEMLFIIIHQVYELWFKQILHEIKGGAASLRADEVMRFVRTMNRIHTIQTVLTQQIDILETMTPNDFNLFRDRLNPASGFQSHQFRIVEFLLGAKDHAYLKFFKARPEAHQLLEEALGQPTVYDLFLALLSRRGFAVPQAVLNRDVSKPHEFSEDIVSSMAQIYRDPKANYDLYMALESLIDVDEQFRLWRFRHVSMVERMIGGRRGTGGSAGAKYLSSTLEKRFFPEVWAVRDQLGEGSGY